MMKVTTTFFFILILFSSHAEVYQLFEENGKKGIKNDQGQIIIPPTFEALGWSDGSFSVIGNTTGYRLNRQWGIINLKKEFLTKAEFESLVYASGDNIIAQKKISPIAVKAGALNLQGHVNIPFVYDGIQISGLRAVVFNLVNGKFWFGLTNLQNHVLLPLSHKSILPLGTLRFAVQNQQSKMALYSEEGKPVTDFTIDSISTFYKGYAIIYENLLQGLMNREGQIKLKPIYQTIKIDTEGNVFARLPSEWVWLTSKNEIVKKFLADDLRSFNNGHQLVTRGGKVGIVNSDFKTVIPIEYENLKVASEYFIASKNKKVGVIDASNQVVVPFLYDSIEPVGGDYKVYSKSIGWQLVNKSGKVKTQKYYQAIDHSNELGFAIQHRNYWGVLSHTGEETIHCVFDSILGIKANLIAIKFRGQYGVIDSKENWKVAPQPHPIQLVNETHYLLKQPGNSFLKTYEGHIVYFTPYRTEFKTDHWVEILPDGSKKKISYEGTLLSQPTQPINGANIQLVRNESEGMRGVQKDGKFGFVDAKGNLRVANRYDSIGEFHEGLAAIKLIGKWGFVNVSDQIVVNPNYQWVSSFKNGFCIATQNGKYGIIDKSGKAVLSFRYDAMRLLPNQQVEIIVGNRKGRAAPNGKIEIEPRFDSLVEMEDGHLIAQQQNLFGVITQQGLSIIPMQYNKLLFDNATKLYVGLKNSQLKAIPVE
jgi:WG containing repeat